MPDSIIRKGMFELKKGLLILMAAMLTLSMASCGSNKKDSDNTTDTVSTEASTQAADNATEEPAATLDVDNAADQVDMGKVEGTKLEDTTSEDSSLSASGEIGNFEVSIEDAKVIDYEGNKVIAISYKFKNNTSEPRSFDSMMTTDVTQNGSELPPVVVTGVEGLNTNSAMTQVESGDSVTLQKTFILRDEASDVNVVVHKYEEPQGASVSKAFKLQ